MAKDSPCRDLVTRWNGWTCPSARNGPRLQIGVLGLPYWVLGRMRGLRASAFPLVVGTLSSSEAWWPKSRPCPWGDSLRSSCGFGLGFLGAHSTR